RVLLAMARMSVARILARHTIVRIYDEAAASVERATSPIAQCVGSELRALAARVGGDTQSAARLEESAIERAEQLGLGPVAVVLLAHRAWQARRGAALPEEILAIAKRGRALAEGMAPAEPLLFLFAAEIDAHCRQGAWHEANAVVLE